MKKWTKGNFKSQMENKRQANHNKVMVENFEVKLSLLRPTFDTLEEIQNECWHRSCRGVIDCSDVKRIFLISFIRLVVVHLSVNWGPTIDHINSAKLFNQVSTSQMYSTRIGSNHEGSDILTTNINHPWTSPWLSAGVSVQIISFICNMASLTLELNIFSYTFNSVHR